MDSSATPPARHFRPRDLLRGACLVAAPAVALLAIVGVFDVAATRVDEYSRHQLGWRYESPAALQDDVGFEEEGADEYFDEGMELPDATDPGEETPLPADSDADAAPPRPPLPPLLAGPSELPYLEPVFYGGREPLGDDPHYNFMQLQFNPLGYGSLSYWSDDAFASGLVERRWKALDPAFRHRIWLASLYPFPRTEGGSEEVAGVLAASGLSSRYKNIGHTFELVARAAASGNHDDIPTFLQAYRKCIEAKRCEGHDFYQRATTAIHDAYSLPAAQLLAKGHCTRAFYLNAIALRMLRAIDPPRFAARATVNRMYMLSAIAEQPECPGQRAAVARAIDNELFGDATPPTEPDSAVSPLFRASAWQGRLPDVHRYARACALLRLRDYDGAMASLQGVRARPGEVLGDMTSLMQVRVLFEQARSRPESAPATLPRLHALVDGMGASSLRSDAADYLGDLVALGDRPPAIAPPPALAMGANP